MRFVTPPEPATCTKACPERSRTGTIRELSLLETVLALVGRSTIVVVRPVVAEPIANLPAGFTAADVAVLDWITAEGRRIGRSYAHH